MEIDKLIRLLQLQESQGATHVKIEGSEIISYKH